MQFCSYFCYSYVDGLSFFWKDILLDLGLPDRGVWEMLPAGVLSFYRKLFPLGDPKLPEGCSESFVTSLVPSTMSGAQ